MERAAAIRRLQSHQGEIRRLGVSSLYLFGSTQSDEAHAQSDVDLFFEFDKPGFSLIDLAALKHRLSEILGAKADVMSRGSLHPKLRSGIEGSAAQVF